MQHYALFRFKRGETLGWLSHTPRGAALALFPYVFGKKMPPLRATFMPDLNFERCKDKRFLAKLQEIA